LSQIFFVCGQLLLKRAMMLTTQSPVRRMAVAASFAAAIGLMSVWYFIWLYCKQTLPVSYLIVFEGISPMLLVLAALLLLREKIGWRTWVAVSLITAGIIVASLDGAG
jgi:drug/metabolite transporter (DMT)-like permease